MRSPMRNDLIVLLLATLVSYPVGLWLRQPWLLPAFNALPAYVVLVHRLRKGERGGAVRAMLWWAAALAVSVIIPISFSRRCPSRSPSQADGGSRTAAARRLVSRY